MCILDIVVKLWKKGIGKKFCDGLSAIDIDKQVPNKVETFP